MSCLDSQLTRWGLLVDYFNNSKRFQTKSFTYFLIGIIFQILVAMCELNGHIGGLKIDVNCEGNMGGLKIDVKCYFNEVHCS